MGHIIWSIWGRYMALAAAVFMIDGAVWSFMFSWPAFPGMQDLRYLYRPVSVPGAAGLFMGLLTLLVEKPVIAIPMPLKPVLYLMTGVFCGLQISCMVGAEFYLVAALVYTRALVAGEAVPASEPKKAAQQQNRGKV